MLAVKVFLMFWAWLAVKQAIIMLLVTSAVKTAPPPGTTFNLYTFLYDWAHQFLNITNTRLSDKPVITPPESAPNPKEQGAP